MLTKCDEEGVPLLIQGIIRSHWDGRNFIEYFDGNDAIISNREVRRHIHIKNLPVSLYKEIFDETLNKLATDFWYNTYAK